MLKFTALHNTSWFKLTIVIEPYVEWYFLKPGERCDVMVENPEDIDELEVVRRLFFRGVVIWATGQVQVFKSGEKVDPQYR